MEEKATTDEGRCSKAPNAGMGTSRARNVNASHRSQTDANCRSQGKGESVPTCNDELCATVLERSGSLPFQVAENLWCCSAMAGANSGKSELSPFFPFLQDEKGNTHFSVMPCVQLLLESDAVMKL